MLVYENQVSNFFTGFLYILGSASMDQKLVLSWFWGIVIAFMIQHTRARLIKVGTTNKPLHLNFSCLYEIYEDFTSLLLIIQFEEQIGMKQENTFPRHVTYSGLQSLVTLCTQNARSVFLK